MLSNGVVSFQMTINVSQINFSFFKEDVAENGEVSCVMYLLLLHANMMSY